MAELQPIHESSLPQLSIYFDGSCEPRNPGGVATAGWVIRNSGDCPVMKGRREICRGEKATNNIAEWSALYLALKWLADNPINTSGTDLRIFGDSQLVVYQLTGKWKCNKPALQKFRDKCLSILESLPVLSWSAEWIPREQNHEADALSRKAYEDATGESYPERDR